MMTAFPPTVPTKHMQMQLIEDKTFGLKNKNKSKSVQVWNDYYAFPLERLGGIIGAIVSSHQPSSEK